MKGHVNKCRKARGREFDKVLERQHSRPSQVITYTVNIEQLNVYLIDKEVQLVPLRGKFEVYKPQRGRRRK